MARRKLNTKVLGVLFGVLVVGAIGAFAANRFLKPSKDPRVLEADGDKAFAAGEYEQARLAFGGAAAIERSNPGLKVKYGDTLIKLTREDPVNLGLALQSWEAALGVDPSYKPALERLLTSRWEQVDLGGGPEVFADIRRRADQLAKADPSHPKAKIWQHVATVRQALLSQAVPRDEIVASAEALQALATSNPTDSEAPFYLAQLKIKDAIERSSVKAQREADLSCDDAIKIISDALKGQEKNAQMQFRASTVFRQLARIDRRAVERKHAERAGACILAAQQNIKSGEPNVDDITLLAAEQLSRDGKADESRQLCREYFEKNPDNQRARLAWARWLSSKKEERDAAIQILAREVPLPKDAVGVGVFLHREQQALTLYELIRLRMADAITETDDEKQKTKLALADTDMERLRRIASPRAPKVLAIEGQLLLIKGQQVEAVKVMEEAYSGMTAGAKDWETVFRLAQAYEGVRQPGRARKLCEELVALGGDSNYVLPARALLADLLIREKRLDSALEQIKQIETKSKDYPGLSQLQTAYLLASGKGAEVVKKLPESTNAERWTKIRFAASLNDQNEQLRLLAAIVANEPSDVNAVRSLASMYRSMKLNDRCYQTVQAGLKANPDEPSLLLFKAELDGTDPKELRELARQTIEKTVKDPFDKAMRLYELEKMGGSAELAAGHLKQALAVRPQDLRALDLVFREALERRQFADAKVYIEALVKLNADQVGGRLYRHRLAAAEQDYVEAERIGLDLVTRYAEFAQSWLALGQAQEALGKWNEAIRSYNEVLARQPMHYEATRALVDTLYNAGRTEDAKARLREMRVNYPNDTTVRELFLNHLANFGEPQSAIADREDQLKKNDNDPWAYLALAATYFKNAQRLSLENKLDESRKEIDKAFEKLSQGQKRFPEDVRFYSQVAEIRQYNGQLEQAEQVLKDFTRRENMKQAPARIRPEPWLALADFYVRTNKLNEAIAALNEALVRADNSLEIRLRLVSTQMQARKFADAEGTLDAVRNNPDPRVARQRLELLIAQQKLAEAETSIRQVIKLRDGVDLRNLLASILIDTGREAEAIVELNRALAMDAKSEASRYLRAMAMAKKRPPDTDGAINELVELKRTMPSSMQARLLLAELYDRTGRRGNAIQDLQDGLKISPGNREVRLSLIRLYRAERPAKFKEAYELIAGAGNDPVMKTDPTWPREAAVLFAQQRMFQQAVVSMTRAVQLSPGNVEYRRELIDMLLQFNDLAGAQIQTEKLLQEGSDFWWLRFQRGVAIGRQIDRKMLADAKTNPTVAAKVNELKSQSLTEFDRALKMSEAEGDVERQISILRTLGETVGNDQALLRVDPKTTDDPTNRWKLLQIGLKRANGDLAGAIAQAERLLADPSNRVTAPDRRGPLLRALADTYQNPGNPDYVKARRYYEELLTLVPDDSASLNNVAYLLAESIAPPEPQSAKLYSERAYEATRITNTPNVLIMDTHGWVLVLCGGPDGEKGRRILQKIVEENPLFIEARYHLGEALLRVQPIAPSQAEKEFTECLRLMNEEEKIGGKIDEKLRGRIQTGLASAREKVRGG
ncbi:tetratricopeptide repeat protein [Humisphaera borealis]|uniref:Tetratricopeptide repeat protein n=1 Tax=Humisphaera borealis TaxID=2807512 RepID=A0A7M2WQ94_9BACT|nr:tetratricopeptide repeat protein [Humisphaera borealis]QOV87658.1 tetratricopeptide repeat protein [Humisphaera borealis]